MGVAHGANDSELDKKTVTSKKYVDDGLATKQPVLSGNGNDVAVTYPETTGGTPGQRTIYTTVGNSTSDSGLVTSGGVRSALNEKQDVVNGVSGSAGKVVLYNNSGRLSHANNPARGVYNGGSAYSGQTTNLVEARHVNTAVKNGFEAHVTCDSSRLGPNSECWLWQINDLNGVYLPQQ